MQSILYSIPMDWGQNAFSLGVSFKLAKQQNISWTIPAVNYHKYDWHFIPIKILMITKNWNDTLYPSI